MSEETRSKRQIIIDAINAGGATIESLAAEANCKYASVMSNFSMLRLMGMHPVKDVPSEEDAETLTYRFVDSEEAAQIKEAQKAKSTTSKAPAKTPAERLDAAEKRFERCEKAEKAAGERADKGNSELLNLRADKAVIELKIAQIELAEAQAACPVEEDGVNLDEDIEEFNE